MGKQYDGFIPGDANQITRDYLDSLLIETRYIGSGLPDTALNLYGEVFDTPIMTAAFSHLDKIYPGCTNGMVKMAQGAAAANAVMWAGMGDRQELQAMIETGAKVIKIIKPYADEEKIHQQLSDALELGAFAVGMDIDHSFNAAGEFDKVSGDEMNAKTAEHLGKYAAAAKLPFVVKGVLSVQDAQHCAATGVSGIVVSHHHGVMDFAVPPLMILPEIVKAVNGAFPIFVDCGISRGLDAFKALALGATAVSVSRSIIDDVIKSGAEGAKNKIVQMNRELSGAMARTGAATLDKIDASVIWHGHRGEA